MRPPRSPFLPLLTWALPQALVLVFAAAQVPFLPAKSMPRPAELLTLTTMLTVQIIYSAMTFPYLFRDARTSLMVILTAVPMTLLATFFSGEVSKWRMIFPMAYVMAWLTGLALWRVPCRTRRASGVAVGLATLWAVGGLVYEYVRAEYGSAGDLERPSDVSPVLTAIAAARDGAMSHVAWLLIGGFVLGGMLGAFATGAIISRRRTA